jgi:hypothetical protein
MAPPRILDNLLASATASLELVELHSGSEYGQTNLGI